MTESRIPWWSRIKVRVLVFGIAMSIVPAVLASLYCLYFTKRDLETGIQIQNRLLAERIVQEVDTLLFRAEEILKDAEFGLAFGRAENGETVEAYRILRELPIADEVVMLDADGFVRLGINRFQIVEDPGKLDWRGPEIVSRLRGGEIYYSPVSVLKNGIPAVQLAVPRFSPDGQGFRGGIGVRIRLAGLFALVGSKPDANRGEVFLIDSTGKLIAHDDYAKVLQNTDVSKSYAVQYFLHNGDPDRLPSPNRYQSYTGQEVLGVYSKLSRTGWGVVVEQPVISAFASIRSLLGKLALFLFIIVAGAVVLSIVFGLSFTKPIERLEKTVRKVGHGALDTRISPERKDELGRLTIAFDEMTRQLQLKSDKLLQEKERLDAIVNGTGVGYAFIYKDYRVAWMNPVLERWVEAQESGGDRSCYKLLQNLSEPCSDCPLLSNPEGSAPDDRVTVLSNRGEQRVLRHRMYRLKHVRPGDPEYLVVVEDITERRRMEEMVMQADKLSALGLMASGFAHEINNPLAVIQAYAEDLEDRLHTEPTRLLESGEINRYLQIIRDNISRSKQITQHLLNFSRRSEWKQEWIHVAAVLEESLSLLTHSFAKKQVQLLREWEADLPRVKGDPLQLMQVIVNLLNNALDAVSPNGTISLAARAAKDCLQIRVRDNGIGIPNANLKKVFDPFFTTKEVGKGTGLGLSICYGIITRMGGTIAIDSVQGQGTEVVVALPIVRA